MQQPQIIEVDPHRIKFNKNNPRKHGGEEYERLKQSIQEIGIVQPPLVRHLTGIFYEVIDGEGRVNVAQDIALPTIKVVNLGDVQDGAALTMLVASNAVRQFGFIAECIGMANLHRQGKPVENIAKQVGLTPPVVKHLVGIGYFPQDILDMLQGTSNDSLLVPNDVNESPIWGHKVIREFLPLRIPKPESKHNGGRIPVVTPLDETRYDFSEVRRAVQRFVRGELKTFADVRAYVADRRRELFEERFSKELRERLDAEIEQARQKLEEARALDIKNAEEGAKQRYEAQIKVLEIQKTETEKQYKTLQAKIAKGGDPETLKKELEGERKKTEEASKKMQEQMQELVRQEQERQRQEQERALKSMQEQLARQMEEQRKQLTKEQEEDRKRRKEEEAKAKEDLDAYYRDKDAKRQLKAEASYRQLVASASQHLAESQQSIFTITSEGMIQGTKWLSQEEIGSLLFSMRAARKSLEEAEEAILKGETVTSTKSDESLVIDNQIAQRSLVNHHG